MIGVRLALALVTMISLWLSGGARQPGPLYVTVVIVFALTVLYAAAVRIKAYAAQVAFIQVVVDVGLETALVYHTGGMHSPFVPLYLVTIASGALVLSARAAVFLAGQATACILLVTAAYVFGLGGAEIEKTYRGMTVPSHVSGHLVSVASFFFVALLSGALSRRLAVFRILHDHILEGIDEGILVLDPELRVAYANGEALRLTGMDSSPKGRPIGEILGQDVEAACAKAFSRQCSTVMKISRHSPDRGRVPMRCRVLPLPAMGSRMSALIIVLADTSAEERAMEAVASKERMEAVSEMAVAIAHEIRNPLASIKGAAQEVMRAAADRTVQSELLEIIMSESVRLDGIVSDFLNFARMPPPVRRPVAVREAIEDAVVLLKNRHDAKGVDFHVECPPGLSARVDPDQLRQILLNLGINALEAMALSPAGGRSLRMSARAAGKAPSVTDGWSGKNRGGGTAGDGGTPGGTEAAGGEGIVLEVSDTGPGMSEETRRRAFDPFFTTKPRGTGMGLAIVARIMQAHGGTVLLTSRPGRGTVATLFFPGDRDALRPERHATAAPEIKAGGGVG